MIIFLKDLLLRRIHCIGGFQPLLGESPTHSPIFFPAPSIPSSTVGLGDERSVWGGCTITHLAALLFVVFCHSLPLCYYLGSRRESNSGAGAFVLPILRCAAPRGEAVHGPGSLLHPPCTQLLPSASVLRTRCAWVWRDWGNTEYILVYSAASPVLQLSREMRCCLRGRGVVQGSTADAAWPALTCQSSTVGTSCTAHAWFLTLRGIIFSSLIPDHNSQNWVSYKAQSEMCFLHKSVILNSISLFGLIPWLHK